MITPEQNQKTHDYLAAADHELAAGNPLAATERLWDAVVCALSAVAQHNGWPHSNVDELYAVAERLNELDDDEDEPLLSGFSSVGGGPDRVRFGLFAIGDGRDEDARMVTKWVIGMIRDLDARHDDVAAKSAR